jgi:hypothetical protein
MPDSTTTPKPMTETELAAIRQRVKHNRVWEGQTQAGSDRARLLEYVDQLMKVTNPPPAA